MTFPAAIHTPFLYAARCVLFFIVLGVMLPSGAANARIAIPAAQGFVAEMGAQGILILQQTNLPIEQREANFRLILEKKFDLNFISRFVLGKNVRMATADQMEEYQALFAEFILRTYASRLSSYAGQKFEIEKATEAGQNDVVVQSVVSGGEGAPLRADWRVREVNGVPQIIDVSVEGVSMSITQREEFASVIHRDGIEGLLEILRARTMGLPAEGPS